MGKEKSQIVSNAQDKKRAFVESAFCIYPDIILIEIHLEGLEKYFPEQWRNPASMSKIIHHEKPRVDSKSSLYVEIN